MVFLKITSALVFLGALLATVNVEARKTPVRFFEENVFLEPVDEELARSLSSLITIEPKPDKETKIEVKPIYIPYPIRGDGGHHHHPGGHGGHHHGDSHEGHHHHHYPQNPYYPGYPGFPTYPGHPGHTGYPHYPHYPYHPYYPHYPHYPPGHHHPPHHHSENHEHDHHHHHHNPRPKPNPPHHHHHHDDIEEEDNERQHNHHNHHNQHHHGHSPPHHHYPYYPHHSHRPGYYSFSNAHNHDGYYGGSPSFVIINPSNVSPFSQTIGTPTPDIPILGDEISVENDAGMGSEKSFENVALDDGRSFLDEESSFIEPEHDEAVEYEDVPMEDDSAEEARIGQSRSNLLQTIMKPHRRRGLQERFAQIYLRNYNSKK